METLLKLGALVEVALGPAIGLRLLHSFSEVFKVFGFELDIKRLAQIEGVIDMDGTVINLHPEILGVKLINEFLSLHTCFILISLPVP